MRGQHPGISQPLPRQQSGYDEMQLLQQHLMYKQLQELQRQQQIQLGHEQKQQSSLNHISAFSRQSAANQLPSLVNGVPINVASNCSWQPELTENDSKGTGNKQMLFAGNMNLAQHGGSPTMRGLMVPHDEGQVLRSMGFSPQQTDQFYGVPISNTRTNQYSQFQGMSPDFADIMPKAVVGQAQKHSSESASYNSFENNRSLYGNQSGVEHDSLASKRELQREKMFVHTANDSVNNNIRGNYQHMNSIPRASEGQGFNFRHDHQNWSGTLHEKEARSSGASQSSTGLDPTEQKILFSSDDDWDTSFGKSIMGMPNMQGNQSEGSDLMNSFPPIQSGSWSALMQSAVAEVSSGDVGMQDEWSGLAFQKTSGNQTDMLHDSLKQQAASYQNNITSANTSNTTNAPYENGEQPGILQSADKTRFSPRSIANSWGQQQNLMSYSLNRHLQDKGNDWNVNGSHPSNAEVPFRVPGSEGLAQHGLIVNNSIKNLNTDRNHNINMWNADMNQVVASSTTPKSGVCTPQMPEVPATDLKSSKENHDIDQQGFYQHVLDSSLNSQGNENTRNNLQKLNRNNQMGESAVSNPNKVSGDIFDRTKEHGSLRELSNESYISSRSHPDHSSESVDGTRDHLSLSGASPQAFPTGNRQNSQVGHEMFAQRLHYHPIGNIVSGNEIRGPQKQGVHGQGLGQMVARGFNSLDQRSIEQGCTSNSFNADTRHANYLQSYAKVTADMHGQGNNDSPSQNMLELLHKVDQSREDDNDATHSSFSDQDRSSKRNKTIISEGFPANIQHQQTASSFHGSGLRLGLSSQRPPASNSELSSHISSGTANDNNTHHDVDCADQKIWSTSAAPVQTYNWDLHKQFISRQATAEASRQKMLGDSSMDGKAGDFSHARKHMQPQQVSAAAGKAISHPANFSLKGQYDRDTYDTYSSLQQRGSRDISAAPSQPSVLGIPGGSSPFRLSSPPETFQTSLPTLVSRTYNVNSQGRSQHIPPDPSIKRNSSQQHIADPGLISQSSLTVTSGMSQHCGISGTSHNVWTNVPTQRLSSSTFQKAAPVDFQSIMPDKLDLSSMTQKTDQEQKEVEINPSKMDSFSGNPSNSVNMKEHPGKFGVTQQMVLERAENNLENISAAQLQVSVPNQASDGTTVHSTFSGYLDQKEKHGKGSSDSRNSQADQKTTLDGSSYALLQQVQAMKAFEANPNNQNPKRFKGVECGLGSQQLIGKPLKFHASNIVGKSPLDDLSAVVNRGSFPTDSRMLSFSSDGTEQQNANKPQVVDKEIHQDLNTSKQTVPQNYPCSVAIAPNNFPYIGRSKHQHVQISPQMAPSWFEQYGNLSNGTVSAMFGGLSGSSQNNAKFAAERYFIPKGCEIVSTQSIVDRKGDAATYSKDQLSSLREISSGVPEHDVNRPKKRKSATSDLLPWHREILIGSDRLQNIRMAERDWAQATNRLVEKVENQINFGDSSHVVLQRKRRLILTTQLMQQLLPCIPAAMLSKPANTSYENVIYLIAKLGLGDACGFISCLSRNSCGQLNGENRISGKSKAYDRSGDQFFLKIMESFVGRARKLETNLNRLEKRASILDIKVECQELEKIAIINRFAKSNGRSQTDGGESSMISETNRHLFVHRHITPHPIHGNVPEGVVCLSL